MSANTFLSDYGRALGSGGNHTIDAPSSGGTFKQKGMAYATATVGAGTYLLPDDGLPMYVKATGTAVIQSQAAAEVATVPSGHVVFFIPLSATSWYASIAISDAEDVPFSDSETAATTVGGALAELQAQFVATGAGHVDLPLNSFRETASGDVGDTTANGGVLSSNTTPILEGSGSTNAQRINWATGNVDPISASITLPPDFDGTAACSIGLICASGGTTNDFDAVIITNWDGGADVSDTVVDAAATAVHVSSAAVAAADIPDVPLSVSVTITPPTHATDAFFLYGVRIRYDKALLEL
jgi:hypothetical protein